MPAFATSVNTRPSASEQRLNELLRLLKPDDQFALLRFAEFLAYSATQSESIKTSLPLPEDIERPQEESVIMAIKRITATYPMINKDKLLHQTSELMAGHVMQGRSAPDVIDELEQLFAQHYQQLKNEFEQNC